jgi:hypothetical protein
MDKYNDSGIYQLKCPTFPNKYIGKTGGTLYTGYTGHMQDIKTNKGNTGFSHHI